MGRDVVSCPPAGEIEKADLIEEGEAHVDFLKSACQSMPCRCGGGMGCGMVHVWWLQNGHGQVWHAARLQWACMLA